MKIPFEQITDKDFKKMTTAEKLRYHADVQFFKIPTGEQFIGARDAVFKEVINLIANWIEKEELKKGAKK